MWQPADGGPAITAAEWSELTGEPLAEVEAEDGCRQPILEVIVDAAIVEEIIEEAIVEEIIEEAIVEEPIVEASIAEEIVEEAEVEAESRRAAMQRRTAA